MISNAKIHTVPGLKNYREQDSQNQLFALVLAWIEMHVILLIHVVYADIKPMHILCWTVPSICQRTAEQQPLHMSGFLRIIYAILNASVILERNETRLARNETSLARNETRGGNLHVPLSGTVYCTLYMYMHEDNTTASHWVHCYKSVITIHLNNELDKLPYIWSSDCEVFSAPRVELERR